MVISKGARRAAPRRGRIAATTLSATALTAVVAGATAAAALAPGADVSGELRTAPSVTAPASEPPVVLVQRVEPQVVLEAGRSSRISAKGSDLFEISELGSFDVPEAALRAYKNAVRTINASHPSCELPWTLLAGIGRVESDHGRYGGSVLGSDGVPRPAIRGVALNGVGPVAAIPDSDNGRFDGDKVWDRAVGPMQFIPTTWAGSGRDGDGDGVADPNDIDDAALAAAGYLCPSSGSIEAPGAMEAAIFSYNHSDYYVALVMAFEKGYRTGSFSLPSPPPPDEESSEESQEPEREKKEKKKDREQEETPPSEPERDKPSKDEPTRKPPKKDGPKSTPTPTPTPTPSPSPSTQPDQTLKGVLDGSAGSWTVDGTPVDFGPKGSEASHQQQLEALVGQSVTVVLRGGTDLVVKLDGTTW